ncbi:phosphatase PAP2 family protein [Nanoarchaeota archaeon]
MTFLIEAANYISVLGDLWLLLPLSFILILFLFYKKKKMQALLVVFGFMVGSLLNFLWKEIFQIPRPENPLIQISGYSFPSGHAVQSLLFFSILFFVFKDQITNKYKKYSFILTNAAIILLVGWSRVYLRTHYWSDVIAGYAFAIIWLVFVLWLVKRKVFQKIF